MKKTLLTAAFAALALSAAQAVNINWSQAGALSGTTAMTGTSLTGPLAITATITVPETNNVDIFGIAATTLGNGSNDPRKREQHHAQLRQGQQGTPQ